MLLNLTSNGLLQEYVYEIGACLLQLDFEEDLNASSRLHQLTSEAMNLIATRTRLDRSVLHAVMHQDVLDMHSNADQPCTHQLDQAFYTRILVSSWCLLGCKALLYLAVLCKSPAKCVLCRAVLCCAVLCCAVLCKSQMKRVCCVLYSGVLC